MKPRQIVIAKNFPMRELAASAQAILKEHGIESLLQSAEIVGAGTAQGVDLCVRPEDKETALQILESLYDGI